MRQPIEASPRDGTAIILEDDASGTYDVAHWSAERGEWLGENGEPTRITPTHWYPVPRDQYLSRDGGGSDAQPRTRRGRRLAAIAALLAAAFIATYFRAEVAAYASRFAGQEGLVGIGRYVTGLFANDNSRKTAVSAAEGPIEAARDSAPAAAQQAAPVLQIAAVPVADEQSSSKDARAEGPAQEPAEARRAIEGAEGKLEAEVAKSARSFEKEREKAAGLALEAVTAKKELAAITQQHRQALEAERARGAALARELANAQRENEKQAGLLKASAEAAQLEQAEAAAARKELAESAEQHRQALEEWRARGAALARDLATAQQENQKLAALLKTMDETAQLKQAEAAQNVRSFEEVRDKASALALEAAAARKELAAGTEQHRQVLEEERARGAAQARELAAAQLDNEKQAALSTASGEAGQQDQAEAAQKVRSLEEARENAAALALEAAAARKELTASAEQHRQALEEERGRRAAIWSELATAQREIEAQAGQLRQAGKEAEQLKKAAESATAELQQYQQRERDRTEALARDRDAARRTAAARVKPQPSTGNAAPPASQATEVAAVRQLAAPDTKGRPEAARLIARASALLGQGDIGAARIVLERASDTGSARASFMLAETYDPAVLAAWGTYGTRSEVTKARDLYARAHAGGIQEARNRLNALPQ